jgi:hypothetical protein
MDTVPDGPPRQPGGLRNAFAAVRARWLRMSPLARDIAVVLLAKAAILGLLWWAFFSTPTAPRMAMDPQRVEGRLLHDSTHPVTPHAQP